MLNVVGFFHTYDQEPRSLPFESCNSRILLLASYATIFFYPIFTLFSDVANKMSPSM